MRLAVIDLRRVAHIKLSALAIFDGEQASGGDKAAPSAQFVWLEPAANTTGRGRSARQLWREQRGAQSIPCGGQQRGEGRVSGVRMVGGRSSSGSCRWAAIARSSAWRAAISCG